MRVDDTNPCTMYAMYPTTKTDAALMSAHAAQPRLHLQCRDCHRTQREAFHERTRGNRQFGHFKQEATDLILTAPDA